jgi:hypothetical protein
MEGVKIMLSLKDLLSKEEDVFQGQITEVFEGIVKWVKRVIYNPYIRETEIVENYEFVDFNYTNIDVNNPPKELEKYCNYIMELEGMTL